MRLNKLFHIYALVIVQGFLSGLPYEALTSTLQVRFISDGASLLTIGCLSLISQIYLYKFIIAPIFDSYRPPVIHTKLGKYKGWIFLNQLGLIFSFVAMALISGKTHPMLLIFVATITAIFSAVQDVNIDSLRILMLDDKQLVNGSSYYLIAFRIASLIAGGIAIYFKPYISWKAIYLSFAVIFVIGINICFIKNKPVNVKHVSTHPFKLIVNAYKDLKNRPYIVLIIFFVLCYGLGDALTVSVNSIFLLKYLKMSMQDYALYANFMNLLMLFLSTYIARYCFRQYNAFYCAMMFGLMQTFTILIYVFLAKFGYIYWMTVFAIMAEGLTGGLVASAVIFIVSSIAKHPFTATQYALFSAITALSSVALGPVAAIIVEHTSWFFLYSLALACSVPGLIIIFYLKSFFYEISCSWRKEIVLTI